MSASISGFVPQQIETNIRGLDTQIRELDEQLRSATEVTRSTLETRKNTLETTRTLMQQLYQQIIGHTSTSAETPITPSAPQAETSSSDGPPPPPPVPDNLTLLSDHQGLAGITITKNGRQVTQTSNSKPNVSMDELRNAIAQRANRASTVQRSVTIASAQPKPATITPPTLRRVAPLTGQRLAPPPSTQNLQNARSVFVTSPSSRPLPPIPSRLPNPPVRTAQTPVRTLPPAPIQITTTPVRAATIQENSSIQSVSTSIIPPPPPSISALSDIHLALASPTLPSVAPTLKPVTTLQPPASTTISSTTQPSPPPVQQPVSSTPSTTTSTRTAPIPPAVTTPTTNKPAKAPKKHKAEKGKSKKADKKHKTEDKKHKPDSKGKKHH